MSTLTCPMCQTEYENASGGRECGSCHVSGVKLWRGYGSFFHPEDLRCVDCACRDSSKDGEVYDASTATDGGEVASPLDFMRGRLSVEIGWNVPLIESPDGAIWGYTSCPPEDIARWQALPLRTAQNEVVA